MNVSLVVYASPSQAGSRSALRFATALLRHGHPIYRIFFYGDGCRHGFRIDSATGDILDQWSQLISEHQLDAVICVTAACKRKLLTESEARNSNPDPLLPGYSLSGLGQLVDATVCSDRVVTFR